MKRSVLMTLGFLVSVCVTGAAPVLFEDYQEGQITIPVGETDTVIVAEVSFFVDSACYVQLATGGLGNLAKLCLTLDGDSLPPIVTLAPGDVTFPIPITYTYLLDTGEHTVSLLLSNYLNIFNPTTCRNAYLQALIFLPDTSTNAVAEPPTSDAEPSVNTPSLISSGPYVNVAGATELVDATGRVIENAIEDKKVFISNLPTGTYFARNGERTVVKIVKVE